MSADRAAIKGSEAVVFVREEVQGLWTVPESDRRQAAGKGDGCIGLAAAADALHCIAAGRHGRWTHCDIHVLQQMESSQYTL